MSNIRWFIGKEGTTSTRMDLPPYKAVFVFFDGEELLGVEDYSQEELQREIQRRREAGEGIDVFEEAFLALSRANS